MSRSQFCGVTQPASASPAQRRRRTLSEIPNSRFQISDSACPPRRLFGAGEKEVAVLEADSENNRG